MADDKPTTEAAAEKPAAKKSTTKAAAAKPAAEKAPAKKAPAKAAADKAAASTKDETVAAPAKKASAKKDVAESLHKGAQVVFHHAMKLERLARGETQRRRSQLGGEIVEDQPLLRGGLAAGETHAEHERVGLVLAGLLEGDALIAIILLVETVKLGELLTVGGNRGGGSVGELRFEVAAQVARRGFNAFVGNERLRSSRVGGHGGRGNV